ncbi:hypothetical protein QFC24_002830 [Naganishia onofrii]|uniref:Uncharacterized protein n=1 Tax=Naganishia onofrii TaxID=1851511 RepID=A0ACC2XPF0_9TREE|nr:hypothetical protein QFC24_002830 [Naganishia onofrii]
MRQKGNSKALWPLLILVNYYLLPTVIGTTYGFPNDNHDHLAYYDEDGNPVSSTTSAAPPAGFTNVMCGCRRGGFPTSTTSPYSATTMYIADSATIISNHPSPSSSPSLSPTAAVHNVLEKAAGIPRNASHLLQPYDDAELPPVDFQHRGLLHIVSRPADPFINIFRHGDSPNNTNNPSGSNQTFKTDTLRASSTMELEPSTVEHDRFLTGKMSSAQMRRHIMLSPNASPVATVAYLVYGYSLDCALTRFPHDWSPNNDLPLPNITEWHETIAEMQRQNVKKQSETLLSAKARVATDAEREIYIHQGRVLQSGINHVEAQKTELDARENDLDAREKKIAGKEKKLDGQLLSAAIKLLNADKVGKQADKIMQKTRKRYRDSMMSDLSKQHRTETTDPCSVRIPSYLPHAADTYPFPTH